VVFSGGPFSSPLSVSLNGATLLSTDRLTKLTFSANGLTTGEHKANKTAVKHSIRGIIAGKGGSAEAYGYILSPLPAVVDGTGLGGLVELESSKSLDDHIIANMGFLPIAGDDAQGSITSAAQALPGSTDKTPGPASART